MKLYLIPFHNTLCSVAFFIVYKSFQNKYFLHDLDIISVSKSWFNLGLAVHISFAHMRNENYITFSKHSLIIQLQFFFHYLQCFENKYTSLFWITHKTECLYLTVYNCMRNSSYSSQTSFSSLSKNIIIYNFHYCIALKRAIFSFHM